MGTYYVNHTSHLTAKEFVEYLLAEYPNSTKDFSVVGNVAYVLCGNNDHLGIAVYKLERYQGDWGYKPMDEDMGPYYYDCPLRLLDKCSPARTTEARAWRRKVREKANGRARAKRIKDGTRVKLDAALSFGALGVHDTFEADTWVTHTGRRSRVWRIVTPGSQSYGRLVRITRLESRGFAILTK